DGRTGPPQSGMPAYRLYAPGPGAKPLPDAVGGGKPAVLCAAVRAWSGRTPPADRPPDPRYRPARLAAAPGCQAVRRHEAEAGPVLCTDTRSRSADPR